jgi:hypothetical protein
MQRRQTYARNYLANPVRLIARERKVLGAPQQNHRRVSANPELLSRSAPFRTGLRRFEPTSPTGIARRPAETQNPPPETERRFRP